jgi:hypothetical protein
MIPTQLQRILETFQQLRVTGEVLIHFHEGRMARLSVTESVKVVTQEPCPPIPAVPLRDDARQA